MALFGPPFWPLTTAQPHPRATVVLVDEVDAGACWLPALSWLPKARTLTSSVFLEELNASCLNGTPDFLSGVFPAAQVAVGSLQTSNRRLRNT
jgi:hypothetical protein